MRNKVLAELSGRYSGFKPDVVLDVGANVGQSVEEFRETYPAARIFAFEPIPATFELLKPVVEAAGDAEAINMALGATPGTLEMTAHGTSTGNRVVSGTTYRGETISVEISTGDAFCAARGIERIGFLKIDAEGFDLKVAIGFTDMFRRGAVDVVQLEVGLCPENRNHASFADVSSFMHALDYRLFRLVGLHAHRGLDLPEPALPSALYADAVFVRNSVTLAVRADTPT